MSVDFTAFDAQLTGTNGAAGSAGGTIDGGDGGNAIESLPPFSNTDFSLEPSLNRVFPTATAGNGGAGAGGANATATTPAPDCSILAAAAADLAGPYPVLSTCTAADPLPFRSRRPRRSARASTRSGAQITCSLIRLPRGIGRAR